ncbi:MAG TPA: hypothetical protein VJR58_31925 [Vineibacter sp.]|nr:hypothetical protein [Vineibacter sp.]
MKQVLKHEDEGESSYNAQRHLHHERRLRQHGCGCLGQETEQPVCDRSTHAAGNPEPDTQCQCALHAHQAYRAERDGDEKAEHRRRQHVGQKLRHFQNGLVASVFACCRVTPMSSRSRSSSPDRASRCRDRAEHRAHQR